MCTEGRDDNNHLQHHRLNAGGGGGRAAYDYLWRLTRGVLVGVEKKEWNTREFNYLYSGTPIHLSSGNDTLRCMLSRCIVVMHICVGTRVYNNKSGGTRFHSDIYPKVFLCAAINNNSNNTSVLFLFYFIFFIVLSRHFRRDTHDRIMQKMRVWFIGPETSRFHRVPLTRRRNRRSLRYVITTTTVRVPGDRSRRALGAPRTRVYP